MTTDPVIPERLHDSSPSTKLSYLAIKRHGPIGTATIAELVGINPRTARDAVDELAERGEISIRPVLGDARRRRFSIESDSNSDPGPPP